MSRRTELEYKFLTYQITAEEWPELSKLRAEVAPIPTCRTMPRALTIIALVVLALVSGWFLS